MLRFSKIFVNTFVDMVSKTLFSCGLKKGFGNNGLLKFRSRKFQLSGFGYHFFCFVWLNSFMKQFLPLAPRGLIIAYNESNNQIYSSAMTLLTCFLGQKFYIE